MKYLACLSLVILVISGCARHSAYDTAQFREREYQTGGITFTEGGLSESQIRAITSTRPPTSFPVDLSLILVKNGYVESEMEQLFVKNVIDGLKASDKVDRIVPIPKFLLPRQLSFSAIQELGVRTLTEYVIVLIVDAESLFNYTEILKTQYRINSTVDFILVDSQTTAILTSDRLFSETVYNDNLFNVGEERKAQNEIFAEQGAVLGSNISKLFE
jgi:hypothetical protein